MRHSRREFIGAAILGVAAAAPTRLLAAFDPLEKNIRELQRAMTAGRVTSAQLVTFYLDRIAAYDQAGPRVNAVIAVNPHAAAYAAALDDERKQERPAGPAPRHPHPPERQLRHERHADDRRLSRAARSPARESTRFR